MKIFSYASGGESMSPDELKKTVLEFAASYPYSNLITIDSQGFPKSRMMENIVPGDDLVFYFATFATSDKVAEISQQPRVNVFLYRPEDHSSISVAGNAEIVMDDDVRREKWKDHWSGFWQQGCTDPAYTLIRIVPKKIVYLDYAAHQKEVLEF
jgi:general stress protein 26